MGINDFVNGLLSDEPGGTQGHDPAQPSRSELGPPMPSADDQQTLVLIRADGRETGEPGTDASDRVLQTATRNSAGPSYGPPGQPPKPHPASPAVGYLASPLTIIDNLIKMNISIETKNKREHHEFFPLKICKSHIGV